MKDLRNMRQNYDRNRLTRENLSENPFDQWKLWMDEAIREESIREPNVMTLATCGKDMQPSCRQVLLKDIQDEKFVWYTNYFSAKAEDIKDNKKAALLFFWETLERQVRIEGAVSKVSRQMSSEYFNSRPRESQAAASISDQSSRTTYNKLLADFNYLLENSDEIICPENWGGFQLQPHYYEFWQGGKNRLHDRWAFTLSEEKKWRKDRLAP